MLRLINVVYIPVVTLDSRLWMGDCFALALFFEMLREEGPSSPIASISHVNAPPRVNFLGWTAFLEEIEMMDTCGFANILWLMFSSCA